MNQSRKLQSGGNTGCKMWTSKYDCQSKGCHWDFNNNCCN